MNDTERLKKTLEYMNILMSHGFFKEDKSGMENTLNNLIYILESYDIITDRIDPKKPDHQAAFDSLKFIANLCLFEDAVMPICRRYNPTEKDKAKFLEWIKEHPVDDPQK